MRAIELINQRMITAASLNLLPGQDNHGDVPETINYAALDKRLTGVTFHVLPQVLHKEQSRGVGTVEERMGERAYEVKSGGNGFSWFVAILFSLLAACVGWLFFTSSNLFGRFAISRDGKRGGGAAKAIYRTSQILRKRLRDRAVQLFYNMPIKGRDEVTEHSFKKFLRNFDFDYTLWHGHNATMTDQERTLIAEQNAFVEAVRLVDEGDIELASTALSRIEGILDKYLPSFVTPAYYQKIIEKSASMAALHISENPVDRGFSLSDCEKMGLPCVDVCSVADILNCDLLSVNAGGFDPIQVGAYVGLLRNLRLMFSTIGTRDFLAVASIYKGKNYRCVEEAMRMDLTRRRDAALATGDEKSFDWINALLIGSLVASLSVTAFSATKKLVLWCGSGGGGSAFMNSVRSRLSGRAVQNGDLSSRNPIQVELENIQSDLRAMTTDVMSEKDMQDFDMMMLAFEGVPRVSPTFVEDVMDLRDANLAALTEDQVAARIRGLDASVVDVITPRADYVVLGADTVSPHFIKRNSISSSEGVHYGSFTEEGVGEILKYNDAADEADRMEILSQAIEPSTMRVVSVVAGAISRRSSRSRSSSLSRGGVERNLTRTLDYAS